MLPELPRVYGFGKLRLENRGQTIATFPTRHVEELFGYLVLHQGVNHPREKIINLLWPNFPIQSARSRLSTVLWRLKGVFFQLDMPPDLYLETTRDTVSIPRKAPLATDIREFSDYIAHAGALRDDHALEQTLSAALALYQGDLFEGLYADWCLLEREQFYRQHLRAMGQLMACLMRTGDYEMAIELGEQILGLDPLREEVHRALMRCHWKGGHFSQAARQFERCTQLLQDELGIGPMPETVALYAAIVEDRLQFVQQDSARMPPDGDWLHAVAGFRELVSRFNRLLDQFETSRSSLPRHD